MPWNDISPLINGTSLDLEIINDLVENSVYLKSIVPDVYVRTNNSFKANSEAGAQMKIQCSSTAIKGFTGRQTFYIPFIISHNGKYVPPVVATVFSSQNMYCQVTKVDNKGFWVTLSPVSKKKITGVKVNWVAVTQVGT
jgi:hypothetical protein